MQSVKDIPFFPYKYVDLWFVLSVCRLLVTMKKRYRPEIWYKHSSRSYLKRFFFQKSDPEDLQLQKTAVSPGFSTYSVLLNNVPPLPKQFPPKGKMSKIGSIPSPPQSDSLNVETQNFSSLHTHTHTSARACAFLKSTLK